MEKECATLWDESEEVLNWDDFQAACQQYSPSRTKDEKLRLLRSACHPIRNETLSFRWSNRNMHTNPWYPPKKHRESGAFSYLILVSPPNLQVKVFFPAK